MCTTPIQIDPETLVACRKCDACNMTYQNDWKARCVAEYATQPGSIALDVTYRNNDDGTLPAHARIFRYSHVSEFIKRLRQAYYRKHRARGEIRAIVAGERGTETGRVHWHMIIFAPRDLRALGVWKDHTNKRRIKGLPRFKSNERKHWKYWPHGHVTLKEVNEGSAAYLAKYACKHQFNTVKAEGTKRYDKSDNHGASYFRPLARNPVLGQNWLDDKIQRYREMRQVVATTELKVPGLSGFWWPRGNLRAHLLRSMREINTQRIDETGAPAPQWGALLGHCRLFDNDMEILNGEEITEAEKLFDEHVERTNENYATNNWAGRVAAQADNPRFEETYRKRCYDFHPCKDCKARLTEAERDEQRKEATVRATDYREAQARVGGFADQHDYFTRIGAPSSYCRNWRSKDRAKRDAERRGAFVRGQKETM